MGRNIKRMRQCEEMDFKSPGHPQQGQEEQKAKLKLDRMNHSMI